MLKLIILLIISLNATGSVITSWELNDVTILMDLPGPKEDLQFLLGMQESGEKGVLIPKSLYQTISPLVRGSMDYPQDEEASMRVVAMRVDPCFKFAGDPKCHPQLRLIWQPVEKINVYTTFDAGLHSFYNLSSTEFVHLAKKLKQLKVENAARGVSTSKVPLNIHPAFKSIKTRKTFNEKLKALILSFAGKENLIRMTFMKQLTAKIWWSFGGFEIKDGKAQSMKLLRLPEGSTDQQFFSDKFLDSNEMSGTFLPDLKKSETKDNLVHFLKGFTYGFNELRPSLETMNKIENPKFHSPESIDCVHCHVTTSARAWLLSEHKEDYLKNQTTKNKYPTLRNTSQSLLNPRSIRALGYLGNKTAISDRVVNETQEVVRALKNL